MAAAPALPAGTERGAGSGVTARPARGGAVGLRARLGAVRARLGAVRLRARLGAVRARLGAVTARLRREGAAAAGPGGVAFPEPGDVAFPWPSLRSLSQGVFKYRGARPARLGASKAAPSPPG